MPGADGDPVVLRERRRRLAGPERVLGRCPRPDRVHRSRRHAPGAHPVGRRTEPPPEYHRLQRGRLRVRGRRPARRRSGAGARCRQRGQLGALLRPVRGRRGARTRSGDSHDHCAGPQPPGRADLPPRRRRGSPAGEVSRPGERLRARLRVVRRVHRLDRQPEPQLRVDRRAGRGDLLLAGDRRRRAAQRARPPARGPDGRRQVQLPLRGRRHAAGRSGRRPGLRRQQARLLGARRHRVRAAARRRRAHGQAAGQKQRQLGPLPDRLRWRGPRQLPDAGPADLERRRRGRARVVPAVPASPGGQLAAGPRAGDLARPPGAAADALRGGRHSTVRQRYRPMRLPTGDRWRRAGRSGVGTGAQHRRRLQ